MSSIVVSVYLTLLSAIACSQSEVEVHYIKKRPVNLCVDRFKSAGTYKKWQTTCIRSRICMHDHICIVCACSNCTSDTNETKG